jgi:hypothetical protein
MDFRINDVLASMPLNEDQRLAMDEKEQAEYLANAPKREAVNRSVVFGHDHKVVKGEPVEQGIGSRGRETMNHFNSVRKYEGDEAYWSEVARVWKDHPKHAEKLAKQGLPKPKKVAA